MNKISKVLKAGVIAIAATVVLSGSVFADTLVECSGATGTRYPNIHADKDSSFPVKCGAPVKIESSGTSTYKQFYGKTQADCAQVSALASDPDPCNANDINGIIQMIINAIIFVIGIVAVVMIIIGGINYATSQGDPSKVKKGKDTILYGIIGLVVALLAYAIVNFVLGALQGQN